MQRSSEFSGECVIPLAPFYIILAGYVIHYVLFAGMYLPIHSLLKIEEATGKDSANKNTWRNQCVVGLLLLPHILLCAIVLAADIYRTMQLELTGWKAYNCYALITVNSPNFKNVYFIAQASGLDFGYFFAPASGLEFGGLFWIATFLPALFCLPAVLTHLLPGGLLYGWLTIGYVCIANCSVHFYNHVFATGSTWKEIDWNPSYDNEWSASHKTCARTTYTCGILLVLLLPIGHLCLTTLAVKFYTFPPDEYMINIAETLTERDTLDGYFDWIDTSWDNTVWLIAVFL